MLEEKRNRIIQKYNREISNNFIAGIVLLIIGIIFRLLVGPATVAVTPKESHSGIYIDSTYFYFGEGDWHSSSVDSELPSMFYWVPTFLSIVSYILIGLGIVFTIIAICKFFGKQSKINEEIAREERREQELLRREQERKAAVQNTKATIDNLAYSVGEAISKAKQSFQEGYKGKPQAPTSCPGCNAPVQEGQHYCEYCGRKII